ncbi:MAG: T9SS type A sorting domain-containing protein, partial [Bacteroidales bacterium]|nr:T9SS type A sorting domain-containing protein [Bacteroidales bacterium]
DADLNVRWTRYFLEPDMFHWATCMTLLRDGKVAIGSFKYGQYPGGVSVVIIKDEVWNVPENQDFVRPYAYYPNPTRDELRLQYSPDVKPTQIELYDIQGRLVKTQRTGMESLNLQGLAAGTFTMRVTLEGGKVFSDKVVKE